MAAVRELVTTLKTELDDTGFKQYEAGCQKIIALAKQITGVMSIAFSVDKVFEFAKGVVESIQSIGKLRSQIMNLARPQDDVNSAMESTYAIAQRLGVSYEGIVGTFRDFLKMSNESKISQDKLLAATENTQKALMVDRVSDDQKQQFYSLIERVEIMGKATPRMIGMLGHISQAALSLLKSHYKTDEDGLRKLAKAGKITADTMLEAFSHSNKNIEDRFAKLPWTISRAWQYGYDKILSIFTGMVTGGKKVSGFIGGAMKQAIDYVSGAAENLAKVMGGLENVLLAVGVAIGIIVSPFILAQFINLISLAAKFALAGWASVAGWAAGAAAVAALTLGIIDLYYWIQGKPSLIATWIGPVGKVKESFENLDLFSSLRAIRDVFQGDFGGAWKEIIKITQGGEAAWAAIAISVAAIGAVFLTWKTFSMFGINTALLKLLEVLTGIEVKAKTTAAAVAKVAGATPGAAIVGAGTEPAKPAPGAKNDTWLSRASGKAGNIGGAAVTGLGIAETLGYVDLGGAAERALTGMMAGSVIAGPPGAVVGAVAGAIEPYVLRGAMIQARQEAEAALGLPMTDPRTNKPVVPATPVPAIITPPPPPPRPTETIQQRSERISREETVPTTPVVTPTAPAIIEPAPVAAPRAPVIIEPAPVAAPRAPVIIEQLAAPQPILITPPPVTAPTTGPGPRAPLSEIPILPIMPPGALGPPAPPIVNNADNKTFTFNNTNAVTVTVPDQAMVADEVTRQVATQTQSIFDRAARDLGRSSPRMEGATG